MADPAIIAAAASIVAVFISIWAVQTARRTADQQTQIAASQEAIGRRMLSIEEAREADRQRSALRADLFAEFVVADSQTVLRIENRGNGKAISPSFSIDGVDLFQSQWNVFGSNAPEVIGSRGGYDFPFFTYDGMARHYVIRINWLDQDQIPGSWESTVSLTL